MSELRKLHLRGVDRMDDIGRFEGSNDGPNEQKSPGNQLSQKTSRNPSHAKHQSVSNESMKQGHVLHRITHPRSKNERNLVGNPVTRTFQKIEKHFFACLTDK